MLQHYIPEHIRLGQTEIAISSHDSDDCYHFSDLFLFSAAFPSEFIVCNTQDHCKVSSGICYQLVAKMGGSIR